VQANDSVEMRRRCTAASPPVAPSPSLTRVGSRSRKSDQLLLDLFNAASSGIAVYSDSTVIVANEAFAEMYGFENAQEVVGTHLHDLIAPHALDRAIAGNIDPGQFECIRRDGSLMMVECHGLDIVFEGRLVRAVSVRDITEHKRATTALREANERFRVTFDDAPSGIALVSVDGQMLQVNPGLCTILGRSAEDLLQKTFQDITHLDDLEANAEIGQQFLDGTRTSTAHEQRYIRADGHEVWVFVSTSLVRDDNDQPRYFIMHFQDITGRKETERTLRTQARLLHLLQRVAVAANTASRPEEAFATTLSAVCSHTRWCAGHVFIVTDEERLVSSGIWHFDHAARFERFREVTESLELGPGEGIAGAAFATGRPSASHDNKYKPRTDRLEASRSLGLRAAFAFPVLVGHKTVAVLEFFSFQPDEPDADFRELMANVGTQLGRVVERARAREQQQELDAARARFVANAAHELRTPLATLRTVAALLGTRRLEMTTTELEECFDMLQRQGENLDGLINELLDLSRIEHGDVDLYFEAVPAHRWVARALETAPPPVHLRVETHVDGEPSVYANPERLNRVLINLLTNAYRAASTSVRVAVVLKGSELVLEVTDDGKGVDADLVDQLFEPFSRGKSEQSGAGLGLAITRRIVDDLGGRIDYDRREHRGARFVVRLPSASHPSSSRPTSS